MSNRKEYSIGCVIPVRFNLTQGEDTTGNGIGFSLPSCAPLPVGDEVVTLSTVSQSSTPTLVGYSGFTPTTPPIKFLRIDASGSSDRCWYGNPEGTGTATSDGYYPSGYSEYDRVTGVFDQKTGKLEERYDNIPGCHHPPALISNTFELGQPTTTNFPTTGYSYVVTKDRVEMTGKGVLFDPVDAPSSAIATGTWVTQLSEPDDEESAIARAVSTPGTSGVASRTVRTTGFSFNLTTVEALLHCSNLRSEFLYQVRYDIKETNLSTSAVTLTPYEVDVPALSVSYDLAAIMLSPNPGFSLELVNYTIFTR